MQLKRLIIIIGLLASVACGQKGALRVNDASKTDASKPKSVRTAPATQKTPESLFAAQKSEALNE